MHCLLPSLASDSMIIKDNDDNEKRPSDERGDEKCAEVDHSASYGQEEQGESKNNNRPMNHHHPSDIDHASLDGTASDLAKSSTMPGTTGQMRQQKQSSKNGNNHCTFSFMLLPLPHQLQQHQHQDNE